MEVKGGLNCILNILHSQLSSFVNTIKHPRNIREKDWSDVLTLFEHSSVIILSKRGAVVKGVSGTINCCRSYRCEALFIGVNASCKKSVGWSTLVRQILLSLGCSSVVSSLLSALSSSSILSAHAMTVSLSWGTSDSVTLCVRWALCAASGTSFQMAVPPVVTVDFSLLSPCLRKCLKASHPYD